MGLLDNKICMITGASRGIGKETVRCFAQEGADIYAHARTPGSIDGWCEELQHQCGGRIMPIYFDLTDSGGIKEAVRRIKKESGRIDVLVNNAGMVTNELMGMIDISRMREMFEVNVFGLTELMQYVVAKFMIRQKSGSIINLASLVAVEGCSGQIAYSASKGAVISLTRSAAKELASHQIRVNAVAPGITDTERIQATIKETYKGEIPDIGMGRLATTKDIAQACLYFASEQSSYVTGQILTVAGGMISR